MPAASEQKASPTIAVALVRGLAGRCPNCGKGRLYPSYLKQIDRCAACGEWYGAIRSEDAAPWFTMLFIGLAMVPLLLVLQGFAEAHLVDTILLLSGFILVVTLLALPRIKGLLLAAFWFSQFRNQGDREA